MGSIQCEQCAATCCNYLALPIDKPKTVRDYDDLRWYVLHDGISIFVEEGTWYIQIRTRCGHLGADNQCMIYESRPRICADYDAGDCDYSETDYGYDHLFTHGKQIEDFYTEKTGRRLAKDYAPPTRQRRARGKSVARTASALVPLRIP